jgi:hypothetical protein
LFHCSKYAIIPKIFIPKNKKKKERKFECKFVKKLYMSANNTIVLNTIEEAIEDIKNGKVVIVVDDEDRENEGDFLTAARNMTPELVNFMAKEGRGLICVPITEERCEELGLDMMVGKNNPRNGIYSERRFVRKWLHYRNFSTRSFKNHHGLD